MRNKNAKGFTLVEVLVALAVFSGVMMTLFSSFNAFTLSSRTIREYEKRIKDSGLGLGTMLSDLEQIFILQQPQFILPDKEDADAQEKYRFSGEPDHIDGHTFSRLSFASLTPVRFHHAGDQLSGIARVTYYVAANEDRFDLHRSDMPAFLPDQEDTPCTDPVLFKDIRGFELAFFNKEGDEHDNWNSRDDEFDFQLPHRIRLTITLAAGSGERKISTQIHLPVERPVQQ